MFLFLHVFPLSLVFFGCRLKRSITAFPHIELILRIFCLFGSSISTFSVFPTAIILRIVREGLIIGTVTIDVTSLDLYLCLLRPDATFRVGIHLCYLCLQLLDYLGVSLWVRGGVILL